MPFETLKDIEILFSIALITVILFKKLNLPSIIGFLAAGIIAGPNALALIKSTHEVEIMAEVGVVLLMFTIGIEFSLSELIRIRQRVFWGGGFQILLTISFTTAAALLSNLPLNQAIFIGFVVSLSSTAILMKLFIDAGEIDTPHGKTALAVLIFQDLCVVPFMLLIPFLSGRGGGISNLSIMLGKALLIVVIAHVASRYIVPWVFNQVSKTRSRELFILSILVVAFGTAWLTSLAGLSLALGAFIAGLAISESEYSHQALGDIIPFRDAFISLFFISIGMLLDLSIVLKQPQTLLVIFLLIILIKATFASIAILLLGMPARIAMIAGISLAQIGEFSFVLLQNGLKDGLLNNEIYQLFLAVAIFTMAFTPILLKIAPKLSAKISKLLPHRFVMGKKALTQSEHKSRVNNHVIIIGYGVNGRNLAKVLKTYSIPYLVVETNPFTVSAERTRGSHIVFGDATHREILEHVHIDKARIIVVGISDSSATARISSVARELNPNIHIIARTRYQLEAENLYKAGATQVIPEELETSIEIFAQVLKNYLIPHDQIEKCISTIRSESYDMLRSLSRRHSNAAGISGFLSEAEIAAFTVSDGSHLDKTTVADGFIRTLSGATIIAIKRNEAVTPNPDPVWEIRAKDVLLLLGTPNQLSAAGKLFAANNS